MLIKQTFRGLVSRVQPNFELYTILFQFWCAQQQHRQLSLGGEHVSQDQGGVDDGGDEI